MNKPLKSTSPVQIICPAIFLILLALAMSFCGCAIKQTQKMKRGASYYLNMEAKSIKTEISRLENQLKDQTGEIPDSKLLFYLALLYSSQHNPSPDYSEALKWIKEYIATDSKGAKNNFEQYIMTLLLEIESNKAGFKKCKNRAERLTKINQKLKAKCDELSEENINMMQIIEKLKNLDIRLEKKRKSID
jgi:hypothetical protein